MPETVLLVDDDPNDRFFIKKALDQLPAPVELQMVEDGEQAVAYLKGKEHFSDRSKFPLPTVMFLDIKMPRFNGFEFLEWLKHNDPIRQIPVIMVSSSDAQADIDRAYELGASAYLVKPVETHEFEKLFKATGEFFLQHAESPSLRPRPH